MTYDSTKHNRRSIRLPAYDYAQAGAYFVTLVTHQRQRLFGEIVDGEMLVGSHGDTVKEEWLRSAEVRREIELDAFVLMPNHIHGIVVIRDQATVVGAHGRAPLLPTPHRPPPSLGSFVAGFKPAVTKRINEIRGTAGLPVWQRNYYDRVIRDEGELNRIRQYIIDNPARWAQDPENPINASRPRNVGAVGEPPLRR